MVKNPKLGIDHEVRLIEAVREQKALYDKRVENYRNKNKELIWNDVAKDFNYPGFGGEECANYWKLLRSQYMAHKRKLSKPSGSGQSGVRPYYRHAELLRFIDDSLGQEKTYSNLEAQDENVNSPEPSNQNGEPTDDNEEIVEDPPSTQARQSSDFRSHTKSQPKRKLDSFDEGLLNLLKQDEKDEFELFGEVVAAKLRKIAKDNKRLALEVQKEINQQIHQAEIQHLE